MDVQRKPVLTMAGTLSEQPVGRACCACRLAEKDWLRRRCSCLLVESRPPSSRLHQLETNLVPGFRLHQLVEVLRTTARRLGRVGSTETAVPFRWSRLSSSMLVLGSGPHCRMCLGNAPDHFRLGRKEELLAFDIDDWDGPIPIERHPMLPPEVRQKLAEELRKIKLKAEERKVAKRRKIVRACLLLFLMSLGALICWTYGSES